MICSAPVYADVVSNAQNQCGGDLWVVEISITPVVDYRALNRVTVRKVFLIPNSDQIKSCVAGSKFISVGDAKEGFNQVENEPESAKKMAVLVASGTYLPRGWSHEWS